MTIEINKTGMIDSGGRYKTLSLFFEPNYVPESAVFTFKERDHTAEGKTFLSLKRLYLELEDPTEYEFANKYLACWKQWQKMLDNKFIRGHVDEWREELEFKLRSRGVKTMMEAAAQGNYQASKWLVDRGWLTRAAGRPSKTEIDGEKAFQTRVKSEYGADIHRLFANQGK